LAFQEFLMGVASEFRLGLCESPAAGAPTSMNAEVALVGIGRLR